MLSNMSSEHLDDKPYRYFQREGVKEFQVATKRRKRKNTPLGGPGGLAIVTTRVVTVNAFVRDERVLTGPYLP